MFKYISSVRPVNLFLIGLLQGFLLFSLIHPVLLLDGLVIKLSDINGVLFVLTTVLIAAGGYIINDYFDLENDRQNKETKLFTEASTLYKYYWILTITGFIVSIYIAYTIDAIPLILIYPLAVGLLYWYSKTLKKNGLIGNVVVALFTAFVPAILLVAEPEMLGSLKTYSEKAIVIICVFSLFSFMINLVRELVKDIEDIDGDRLIGNRSLPISMGIDKTKVLIYFQTAVLVLLVLLWTVCATDLNDVRIQIFNAIFIIAPLSMSILRLSKSKEKIEFHKVATLYKWIMLSGMISLLMLINKML